MYTGNKSRCSGEIDLPDESPCFSDNVDNVVPAQCCVVTLGTGETGQLGLGPDVLATTSAMRVPRLSDVVQVAAGGMHTVCLDVHGKVMQPSAVCLSVCLSLCLSVCQVFLPKFNAVYLLKVTHQRKHAT